MPYKDKEYGEQKRKSWYERHREAEVRRALEKKMRMREIYQELKANLRCADCGETHPACTSTTGTQQRRSSASPNG